MSNPYLWIAIGAVFGAGMRYYLGGWVSQQLGPTFPFGTLSVNLLGSFFLGLFLTLATERFVVDPRWRTLIAVGFFGSFTTFSSYTFESMTLVVGGQWSLGMLNLFGSAVLGALAALGGILMGRLLV